MSKTANLHCACREVSGLVANASPKSVNRVVCYCDDCQAFLHALSREDLLDTYGGTDIVQIAPGSLSFTRGEEHIVGLRLTSNRLYRWFAKCCNTPLGNTVGPAMPLVGIIAQTFRSETQRLDDLFGPPIAGVFGKYAIGHPPQSAAGLSLRFLVRAVSMMLRWRIRGEAWPNPFFERETREPRFPVTILSLQDREALRPLCGPSPSKPKTP